LIERIDNKAASERGTNNLQGGSLVASALWFLSARRRVELPKNSAK
jgi:hypothetical protein